MRNRIIFSIQLLFVLGFTITLYAGDRPPAEVDTKNSTVSPQIWIITDIHYLADSLRDDGEYLTNLIEDGDAKNLFILDELMDGFLTEVRDKRPDALLITGDLTFNGAKKSHKELAKWFAQIEDAGTEVFVIPGNHDVENPWARRFKGEECKKVSTVSAEEFAEIYGDCGYDQALCRDPSSLSYLVEPIPGLQILMLDSCIYSDSKECCYPESFGQISTATREWITACTAEGLKEGKKVIAAMHHSLLEYNASFSYGYTVDDNDSLCRLFSELGIQTFLTGHTHFQDIIEQTFPAGVITDFSTNAFSVYPHDYGTLQWDALGWYYSSSSLVSNPDLFSEDFRREAEEFFLTTCSRYFQAYLCDSEYSEGDIALMSRIYDTVILNFFSGKEFLNASQIKEQDLDLDLCLAISPPSLSSYLEGKLSDAQPFDLYHRF